MMIVTGGAGFIGSCLVAALKARGQTVVAVDRPRDQARDFIWEGDLIDIMPWFYDHPKVSGLFNLCRHDTPARGRV